MKRKILWSLVVVFACAVTVQADKVPLVELLFNDVPTVSTANLGSLGGTQNLPGVSGYKSSDNLPPVSFDSGMAWVQAGYSATGYGDYNLPAMSQMTVAFWLDSVNVGGFRNIWSSNLGTADEEIGAYTNGATINILGPGGSRYITADVIPTETATWTHIAYTYDSSTSTFHLYVNGVDTSYSGSWSGAIAAASDDRGFGIADTTASNNLYGLIDNLFIYDSVLSQGEIQSLMMTNVVPEPATLMLLVFGGAGFIARRVRK